MKTIKTAFNAGELAPSMWGRVDVDKYAFGLRRARNVFVQVRGGVSNRPGTRFIGEVPNSGQPARLVPFQFNRQQTYALEFTPGLIRVIRAGAYVPGVAVATPYAAGDLFDIGYVQSNDVLYLTHPNHAPRKLSRLGESSWTLTTISFTPQIGPPSSVTASGGSIGPDEYDYVVTAWAGSVQSLLSVVASAITDFTKAGAYIDVSWSPVPGADDYFVYRRLAGVFGYIGHSTTGGPFRDNGIVPNVGVTAPTVPSAVDAPAEVVATPYNPNLDTQQYAVTALSDLTGEESVASGGSNVISNDLDIDGAFNTISWTAVSGASRYNVYKLINGVWGYIGGTTALTYRDDNIIADSAVSPPGQRNPFTGAGNYPSTATFFEQRIVYAATNNNPQTCWASNSAAFENMNVSSPAKDNEAITWTIASRQADRIRHMVPMGSLLLLTDGAEWKVNGGGTDDIMTPSNVRPRPQTYYGCSIVPPLTVGGATLYVDGAGRPRDLAYSYTDDAYAGSDLALLAAHFFPEDEVEGEEVEDREIVDWAYAKAPHGLLWAVRADGKLLCLTYLREQSVFGWTLCETDGHFESVCAIREGRRDAVYFIVRRTVGGVDRRYVERLEGRTVKDVKNAFFVDSGLSRDGAPVATVSGLDHLEGKAVVALCDGNVVRGLTVAGGSLTFSRAYSRIHVGLPYESVVETLDLDIQARDGTVQGRKKKVVAVTLRLEATRGFWVGPAENKLVEFKQRAAEPMGTPVGLFTGDASITITPAWNSNGRVVVKQIDPLPITILAAIPEFEVGG